MKTDYSISSYRTSHFQYQTLDKIHGEPTLDTLLHLFKQLKINAQSVPTKLGGGQLGYLALVIHPDDYNKIPNTLPFVRPTDPGVFKFNPTNPVAVTPQEPASPVRTRRTRTTASEPGTPTAQRRRQEPQANTNTTLAIDVAQQKALHDEKVRCYHECQAVEQALRQQLIEAVDPEYLEALRDPITYMIQEPIPTIIDFLQEVFGQITPQELADREETLKNFTYDPIKPVDIVFNKITQFKDLCSLCKNDKTEPQLVQLAYIIFNKSRIFTDALKEWNKTNPTEKTYSSMKIHMRQQYQELKQVGALTVEESSLHQVNLMNELTANMKS